MLYIQVPTTHCHRLLPFNGPHRVVKRLWEEGSRVVRQPKEDVGSTPPREVKTRKTNKGFFVTNSLYPTGAGIGLVGERFCLDFSLIFPIALSSFYRKGLQGEHGVLFTSWLKKEHPETDQKFTLADAAR